MKVIESFDRATNVREIKLLYTTLHESLTFATTPKAVENKKSVNKITESIVGGSSKTMASTKPTVVLTEQKSIFDTQAIDRMKKLANIR